MRKLTFLLIPLAVATTCWAQGALPERTSISATRNYDMVEREVLNPKDNTWRTQHGSLLFDAREQVRFVSSAGGQFRLPYRAIRAIEYSFYNPVESSKNWTPSVKLKVGGKRYLTIRYDVGNGVESTILALQPEHYQQVIGTFQSKTGIIVARDIGGYEKHW